MEDKNIRIFSVTMNVINLLVAVVILNNNATENRAIINHLQHHYFNILTSKTYFTARSLNIILRKSATQKTHSTIHIQLVF
ncbi:hypothetical protein [Clostridium fungisolvens]|uniref:Uncharacterized protein n=1 Tax=Clostridium fungisolvens TaxID=1604897 RepID=A0A6V8SBL8_9CLOT|nr:hypothetical protein [Clostridium fungisolvens]GFP74096.1 hypothetical protein bsdtw1_00135 [Clostridium fungisolvens]